MKIHKFKDYALDIISKMEYACQKNNTLNGKSMELLVIEPLEKSLKEYEGDTVKDGLSNLKSYLSEVKEYSQTTTAQYNSLSILDEMQKIRCFIPTRKIDDQV